MFRSSKRILYDPSENTFSIHNEIDDSYIDDLTEDQLKSETMIIEAIEKKALFLYWQLAFNLQCLFALQSFTNTDDKYNTNCVEGPNGQWE